MSDDMGSDFTYMKCGRMETVPSCLTDFLTNIVIILTYDD